jgi:hypothetical protein
MGIEWYQSESMIRPDPVCLDWSPNNVYLHRNVHEEERKNLNGSTYTMWVYEEAKLSRADYAIYASEQVQANVDYIAVMSDIDLDV